MTKNNWFEVLFNGRTKETLADFQIKMTPYQCSPYSTNFSDATIDMAQQLAGQYPRIYLAFSGGIYSEFVLHQFRAAKIKFVPIILESQFNKYEFEMADIVCEKLKIDPWVISLSKNDLVDRLRSLTYDKGLHSFEGGIPLILAEEVERVGGSLITGNGHFFDYPEPRGHYWRPFYQVFDYFERDFYVETQRPVEHPGAFYNLSLELYQAMFRQTDWGLGVRAASCKLFEFNYREKEYLDESFYNLADSLNPFKMFRHKVRVGRDDIRYMLEKFVI